MGNALLTLPHNVIMIDSEFLSVAIKLIPVIVSFLGAILAFIFYSFSSQFLFELKTNKYGIKLYTFFNRKWFFDKVYNEFIASKFLSLGYHLTYKVVDRGLIEKVGPYGITQIGYNLSLILTKLQSGFVFHYAFIIFSSFVFFILLILNNFIIFFNYYLLFLIFLLIVVNEYLSFKS